jgi:hypothetical protein
MADRRTAMRPPAVPTELAVALEQVARDTGLTLAYDTHYDAGNAQLRWWSGTRLHRLDFQPSSERIRVTHLVDTYPIFARLLHWAWLTVPMFPYLARIEPHTLDGLECAASAGAYERRIQELLRECRVWP